MTWTRPFAIVLIAALLLWGPASYPVWAQSTPPAQDARGTDGGVAAGFANVLYVPGKAIICATSGVLWFTIMAVTFGHSYNAATNFVEGGCGGKWVLSGADITAGTSQ